MGDGTQDRNTLHSVMCDTLGEHRLAATESGSDEPLRLVDLLSDGSRGGTADSARTEIGLIVDALAGEIIRHAPDSAARRIVDALGIDTGADASLNLEGAIDSLTIAHRMSEDNSIIRTLRRVLGQIEEVSRLAQIENARPLRG